MTELLLTLALIGLAVFCSMLALELYHELRRAWFFRRTRKHVEQEWKQYYERQLAQEAEWHRKA